MISKAGLLLMLCALAAPCLVHAQKPTNSDCKTVGTPPICLFDTSYCPTTTEVACEIGDDVDTLITYANADDVITGVVNQTSGSTTVTGQDGISVGVTFINESNNDFFDGWFYPATFNVTSTGTYNLSGGTLTAGFETVNGIVTQSGTSVNTLQSNKDGSAVYIHCTGLGSSNCTTIDEEQGTIGQLNVVGTGAQYNLESGTLNAPTLVLDSGGTFTQKGGVANVVEGQVEDETITTQPKSALYVGYNSTGTYNITLGTLQVGGATTINGTSGTLTVAQTGTGSYGLTGGTLNAGTEYVAEGMGSEGTFTQATGSTNSMAANDILYVGYGGQGTYNLSGGTVKAHEEVGGGGNGINSGNGTFTETNGTNTITASGGTAGNLEIGDVATGIYNLDGGKLTAVSMTINSTGSMVIHKTGSAAVTLTISGTTMNDGVMSFTDASASPGAFTNDGSLALNATTSTAGKLTLGTYTQGSGGTLSINLDGTTVGTNYYALNISGAATLGGTLDLSTGFTPVVGDTWDILNYASETGRFATVDLPTAPTGDHYIFSCGAKDCTLTLDSGAAVVSATQHAVSGSPAKRISRAFVGSDSSASEQQPVAILSRATCFGARLLASASCGTDANVRGARGRDGHALASNSMGGEVHNNIMVATRSISLERGGASRESSASSAQMARLYVCAYLPVSVAQSMGCN